MIIFSLIKRHRLYRALLPFALGLGLAFFLGLTSVPSSVAISVSDVPNLLVDVLSLETFSKYPSFLSTFPWEGRTLHRILSPLYGAFGSILTMLLMLLLLWRGGLMDWNPKLYLTPTGRTLRNDDKAFLFGINWLVGNCVTGIDRRIYQIYRLKKDSHVFDRYLHNRYLYKDINVRILRSIFSSFFTALMISLISVYFLRVPSWHIALFTWLWLGYEIFVNTSTTLNLGALINAGKKLLAMTFCLIGLLFFPGLAFVLTFYVWPPTLPLFSACLGAWVGALSLRRSLVSSLNPPACRACDQPMKLLPATMLKKILGQGEAKSWDIGACVYEGWHCPICHPSPVDPGGDLHLFYKVITPHTFNYCDDCESYTVSTRRIDIKKATYESRGEQELKTHCACCQQETSEIIKMSRLSRSNAYWP